MDKRDKIATAVNTATEPALLFYSGNAIISLLQSTTGGIINISASIFGLLIRLCGEIQKRGGKLPFPLPAAAQKFINNSGAALGVNGVFVLTSAGASALEIDPTNSRTFVTPIMLTCFGTGAISIAFAQSAQGAKKTVLNTSAQLAYSLGMYLAAGDAPMGVKAVYVASFISSILLPLMKKEALGPISPNRITAVGAFASAATNTDPNFIVANILFGLGYLSVDAFRFGIRPFQGVAAMLGLDRKPAQTTLVPPAVLSPEQA
ncbi:MAG: hypothetical protein L6Q57_06195 [Alphaproteobacteria bacterium]|nr:hypothetical protein [Alphaproteobacteria bacterium]